MPGRRGERVSKRIIQELVDALRRLKYDDLGFVTITGCETSPDLRHAKVMVSVLGGDDDRSRVLDILRRNASRLRRLIGRPLGIKVVPELHFEMDLSLETSDRISRLIRDARLTDANPNPLPEAAPSEPAAAAPESGAAAPPADAFESVRLAVEDELPEFADDDPAWRPINLDDPPDGGEPEN